MFRFAHVLLTIAGILACPFVCMEPVIGGDPDQQLIVFGCHNGDISPPCCGDGCCGSDAPRNSPEPSPRGCSGHPCVCNGALEARQQRPLDNEFGVGDALPSHGFLGVVPERLAAVPVSRIGDGPPFSPLSSGRAIRLALESLLL